jgi:MYXO-CTERM domain-containing protein
VLNIAPAGTLVQADAGNQAFTLVVEDGTHSVLIRVDAFVFGSSGSMFFLNSPTLPTATIDAPYGPETLMVQGGTAPYTFNEVSGTWPAGITLDTTTGEISGTPTELGTLSIEVRVIDANNDSLTETFTLTVMQEVSEAGGGTTTTENTGCSSTTGSTSLLLLALLAGLAGLRFARSRSA